MSHHSMVVPILAGGGILALLSCAAERGADPAAGSAFGPPDARTPAVMREKLVHAHGLLDALAVERYDAVAHHADRLTALSEQSDWHVHETVSYVSLSERFRDSTRALAARAREGDRTRVSDAYITMMQECLACHEYLRAEGLYRDMPGRVTRRPGDPGAGANEVDWLALLERSGPAP